MAVKRESSAVGMLIMAACLVATAFGILKLIRRDLVQPLAGLPNTAAVKHGYAMKRSRSVVDLAVGESMGSCGFYVDDKDRIYLSDGAQMDNANCITVRRDSDGFVVVLAIEKSGLWPVERAPSDAIPVVRVEYK